MIPTKVIPICTVERNLPGSPASSSAVAAATLPPSALACRRVCLAETIASSDIAKTPLSTINPAMMIRSVQGKGVTVSAALA